jgi:hypothetical protein
METKITPIRKLRKANERGKQKKYTETSNKYLIECDILANQAAY